MKLTIRHQLAWIMLTLIYLQQAVVFATTQGVEPLAVRSQSMGQFFRFDPLPLGTHFLKPGQFQVKAVHAVANQWGYEKRFIVDGQTQDDAIELRAGLSGDWYLGLGFGSKRVKSSYTDQVTIGFHNMFFIPQDKRTTVDMNRTQMTFPEYGIEITEEDHGSGWTQHGYARLGRQILQVGPSVLSLGLLFANEFAENSLMGRGSLSYGGQFQASTSSGRLAVLSSLTWVKHEAQNVEETFWLRQNNYSWLMASSIQMVDWELMAQTLIHRGAAHDLGQYSRHTYEIHLGMRKRWQQVAFELAIIENVIWHFNTPDWGFTLGMSYQNY